MPSRQQYHSQYQYQVSNPLRWWVISMLVLFGHTIRLEASPLLGEGWDSALSDTHMSAGVDCIMAPRAATCAYGALRHRQSKNVCEEGRWAREKERRRRRWKMSGMLTDAHGVNIELIRQGKCLLGTGVRGRNKQGGFPGLAWCKWGSVSYYLFLWHLATTILCFIVHQQPVLVSGVTTEPVAGKMNLDFSKKKDTGIASNVLYIWLVLGLSCWTTHFSILL